MTTHTHQTSPTQYVQANGIRFAYRRFGKQGNVPIVFNQHYLGTMDHWDPAVTDGLARDREVILFNNAGVSSSSGEVPTTVEEMGANAVTFIKALGPSQVECSESRSAALSLRKSRCRRPNSSASWSSSAPAPAAARDGDPTREAPADLRRRPMTRRSICGSRFISVRPRKPRLQGWSSSSASIFVRWIAIPR